MFFQVVESRYTRPDNVPSFVLMRDSWNDHGYTNTFRAFYVAPSAEPEPLGIVKILQRAEFSPALGTAPFERLPEAFCSLGQANEYYDRLLAHGAELARSILTALRDLAMTPDIEAAFADVEGLRTSLLRFPRARLARDHARAVFGTTAAPAVKVPSEGPLAFRLRCKLDGFEDEHRVDFAFPDQEHGKLGRIMAIAGRNGTGKTQLMACLAQTLSGLGAEKPTFGRIEPERYARVVVVSFNAFDQFTAPLNQIPGRDYTYYGLRRPRGEVDVPYAFKKTLADAIENVWRMGEEHRRDWSALLVRTKVFESEPHLSDPLAAETANLFEVRPRVERFVSALRTASAGHQLLVFILTALVESVQPGSVLLLDEPETHLHPRLLSTLVRLLYDMLVERRAYAVIATHSPIVLQEIPGKCIRLLRIAEGRLPLVKPYPRESFGEALDEIIQEAFGVHEGDRSYRSILGQLVKDGRSRAEIEARFDGLGYGARLLLRELLEQEGAQ